MTKYYQWRLAKCNGEIFQQRRLVTITTRRNKWYKPWEYTAVYTYGEWETIDMVEIAI
jgi:hypothetical protein